MAKIYLVRHAEAEAGWTQNADPKLSKDGFAQALETAKELWKLGQLHAVSSPMQRCLQSAAPYVSLSGALGEREVVDAVSEIPSPDGLSLEERGAWLRKVFQQSWSEQDETLKTWRENLVSYLGGLTEDTIVFTHYVAINAAVGAATGNDAVLCFQPDNGSITILEVEDGKLSLIEKGAENTTKIN